jgi:hypothetical protein
MSTGSKWPQLLAISVSMAQIAMDVSPLAGRAVDLHLSDRNYSGWQRSGLKIDFTDSETFNFKS